jgi:O-antigen/teichoic acid export membrane protein
VIPAVAFGVYAAPFLRAYVGREDVGEIPVVFVLLLAGVACNVASFAAFSVLQLKLHLRALAIPHVAFFLLHAVACIVLAYAFGPVGAALSWSLGMLILWLALQVTLHARYKLKVFGDLVRIFLGGAVSAGALLLWKSRDIPFSSAGTGMVRRLLPVLSRSTAAALLTAAVVGLTFLAGRQPASRQPEG